MIASILLGLWLGMKTDQWLHMKNPVFTVVFILLFLSASLILLIRSLPKS
jgi:F0F1-type ATP synthase assembly protein I